MVHWISGETILTTYPKTVQPKDYLDNFKEVREMVLEQGRYVTAIFDFSVIEDPIYIRAMGCALCMHEYSGKCCNGIWVAQNEAIRYELKQLCDFIPVPIAVEIVPTIEEALRHANRVLTRPA